MEEIIRKYFQCWLNKDMDAVKGIEQIIRWFEDWNQKGTIYPWDVSALYKV